MGRKLDEFAYWLSTAICAILVLLFIPVLVKAILYDAWGMIYAYKWEWWKDGCFIGIIAGFALYGLFTLTLKIPRVEHNLNWFMNFTHELTHTLVAVLFFAKIREFVVKDRECYVSYKAGPIGYVPITLSPYCIPIYTFMLLPFRFFGHSIGVPLAVSTNYSMIVPSGTMVIHPVRMSGTVIGAPATYDYFKRMQDRIISFIVNHSNASYDKLEELMLNTQMLTKDVGTILVGKEAVEIGLINEIGGIADAFKKLKKLIKDAKF